MELRNYVWPRWNLDENGINLDALVAARQVIAHRGPDDDGLYVSEDTTVGLGFRRAIVKPGNWSSIVASGSGV